MCKECYRPTYENLTLSELFGRREEKRREEVEFVYVELKLTKQKISEFLINQTTSEFKITNHSKDQLPKPF